VKNASREERVDMRLTSSDRKGNWLWTILQGSMCGNRFVAGNASTQPDAQEQM
jgi:hypothetical protein